MHAAVPHVDGVRYSGPSLSSGGDSEGGRVYADLQSLNSIRCVPVVPGRRSADVDLSVCFSRRRDSLFCVFYFCFSVRVVLYVVVRISFAPRLWNVYF